MATTRTAAATGSQGSEMLRDVRSELEQLDEQMRTFVKERPIMALLSAVALGYVVGRILRRHA